MPLQLVPAVLALDEPYLGLSAVLALGACALWWLAAQLRKVATHPICAALCSVLSQQQCLTVQSVTRRAILMTGLASLHGQVRCLLVLRAVKGVAELQLAIASDSHFL